MKLKLLSISAVLCLVIMTTGARPGLTQALEAPKQDPEWLSQMYQEGWRKVQEGVLQRDEGGGQVETFSYGAEGLRYRIQDLEEHVSFLESQYNNNPTEELARIIDHLNGEIVQANASLQTVGSAEEFEGEQLQNCDFAYGAHAYATPLSGAQGVTSSADAYFHNNCGKVGNTFAYAQSEAAIGTTLTTKTQQDPRSGGWVDSYATTSVQGSSQCHSWAYAEVTSYDPYISYYTPQVHNYSCPVPLSVSVSGSPSAYTDYNYPCVDVTWTASASGGTPGYAYNWYINSVHQGSGYQLTKRYCYTNATVTATAIVNDSGGQTAQGSYTTTIYYDDYIDPCQSDPYQCGCPRADPYYCGGCYIQADPNSSTPNAIRPEPCY